MKTKHWPIVFLVFASSITAIAQESDQGAQADVEVASDAMPSLFKLRDSSGDLWSDRPVADAVNGPVDTTNKTEDSTLDLQAKSAWTFELSPYLWMANIGGQVGFGPLQAEPDVGFLDLVKRLDMGFMLHFEGRKDRWGFFFDGLYMSLSGDAKVDLGHIPLFGGFDVGGRFRQTLIKFGAFIDSHRTAGLLTCWLARSFWTSRSILA